MAEDCVERGRRERRGSSLRDAIRSCLPGDDFGPMFFAYWLDYSRRQAVDLSNPPDERRAWAELAEELGTLA